MRKSTLAAALFAAAILILGITRERWLPPSWNEEWHHAWLEPRRPTADPRVEVLTDHQKRVEEIEADYRARIEAEKARSLELQRKLEELRQARSQP